jgi:acetoacetate decarboxylase
MPTDGAPLKGRLTKDRLRASMPVDAPYYQQPPYYWRDARSMTVLYQTDAEAAAELLPEGLEVPQPAQAALMVLHYPQSTVGPYSEAILGVQCSWEGTAQLYVARIVVDSVPPLVVGREVYGFPKKMARIELSQQDEFLRGTVERPTGVRLVTATLRPERPLPVESGPASPVLALRVIPSPEEDAPPSLAELVQVPDTDRRVHEAWSGPATLSYDTASALDPWHALPVQKVLGGLYTRYDFTLPYARVLRRY